MFKDFSLSLSSKFSLFRNVCFQIGLERTKNMASNQIFFIADIFLYCSLQFAGTRKREKRRHRSWMTWTFYQSKSESNCTWIVKRNKQVRIYLISIKLECNLTFNSIQRTWLSFSIEFLWKITGWKFKIFNIQHSLNVLNIFVPQKMAGFYQS